MSFDQDLKEWIVDFAGAESESSAVETWVLRVLRRISEQVVEVREDAALQCLVRDACEAHWRAFLASFTQPSQPDQTFHLVEEARQVSLLAAQRGYPLSVVLDAYTAGEQAVWEFITTAVKGRESGHMGEADALAHFWSRSSKWIDQSVEESVALYQQEIERNQ